MKGLVIFVYYNQYVAVQNHQSGIDASSTDRHCYDSVATAGWPVFQPVTDSYQQCFVSVQDSKRNIYAVGAGKKDEEN